MKLVNAASLEMEAISWTWPGRIPAQCVTLLEGDPGTGKSQISCALASHVSRGIDWPDGEPCISGHVIMANAEDPENSVILPRLVAAKSNLEKISIIVPSDDKDKQLFTIPDNVAALEEAIKAWGVRLLIFDPLEAFLSAKTNNYSNHVMRHALHSLETLAKNVDCSIVIVRHLTKDTGKSAIYRGGGSIGIIGAARASILVSRDPADRSRCLMVPNKANWSIMKDGLAYKTVSVALTAKGGEPIQTSKVVWDGETKLSANDVLQPSTDLTELTDLNDAADFLRNALAGGIRFSGDVFKEGTEQGFAKKTIYHAAKMVDVIKTVEGHGKDQRWMWELTADVTSEFMEAMPEVGEVEED